VSLLLPLDRPITDETYVELVRSLFVNVANTVIMAFMFTVVSAFAAMKTADPAIAVVGLLGWVFAIVRIVVLLRWRPSAGGDRFDAPTARKAEVQFGAVYLAFAALLGLFAGRVVQVASTDLHMVMAALIVGYAAGVAAVMSLRPWICVPSMVLAVVPVIAASVFRGGASHLLLAFILTALLAGGSGTMLARYRSETEKIGLRQLFGTLARKDHLTGLANRLCLTEAFAAANELPGGGSVAVHCLDLDGFKQVNDVHGHLMGDALLIQVGERLLSAIRAADVAARLGGDEFVVLQAGIRHPDEAERMAERVVRSLRVPYPIGGKQLSVGVSVGYAVASSRNDDLTHLLECADRALYRIKRAGGGAAAQLDPEERGNVVRLNRR
jgi:diguanylate cyclase